MREELILNDGRSTTVQRDEVVEQVLVDCVEHCLAVGAGVLLGAQVDHVLDDGLVVNWTRMHGCVLVFALDVREPALDPLRVDGVVALPRLVITLELVHMFCLSIVPRDER